MTTTKTTSPAMIGTIGDMRRDFGWTSEPGEAEDVNICDEEA